MKLGDLPDWALRSDLSQLQRRLNIILDKEKNGVEQRRGKEYKTTLIRRIKEIESELARRKSRPS